MKPIHVLIFVLSVLSALAFLMLIFPEDGIKITDNFTLQFETWEDFWHNENQNVDITEIVENNVVDEDTIVQFEETPDIYDTAFVDGVAVVYKPVVIDLDSSFCPIEFPDGNDTMLFDLFRVLGSLKNIGKKVHILHYGDSQIEVDRMTSYIRYKLQGTFGGYGFGFHSGIQAFNFSEPAVVTYSDNWFRYKVFPHKDSLVQHRRFGITTSFSMFKAIDDTTNEEKNAWIEFSTSPLAYSDVKKYNVVKLFYGYNDTVVNVNLIADGEPAYSDELPTGEGLRIKTWTFEKNPKTLRFEYSGKVSPEIYGYSFESYSGVMVDNLPVRGSAGLFFGRLDFGLASQIYANMDVRLILMQFGGNAVGGDTARIKSYVKSFGKQLGYLHKLAPEAQIIVIGPADMSEKKKDSYVTRSNLPFLIEELRKTAFEYDCAFWNMYEAMGGKNSMPSWVFHDPPLAEKDFVHFTPQGAKIVSQMFYKAFVNEYNKFVVVR